MAKGSRSVFRDPLAEDVFEPVGIIGKTPEGAKSIPVKLVSISKRKQDLRAKLEAQMAKRAEPEAQEEIA